MESLLPETLHQFNDLKISFYTVGKNINISSPTSFIKIVWKEIQYLPVVHICLILTVTSESLKWGSSTFAPLFCVFPVREKLCYTQMTTV